MQAREVCKILALSVLIVSLCSFSYAEDTLKPIVDEVYQRIKNVDTTLGNIFFSLFPTFKASLSSTMGFVDKTEPFLKDFHWVIYLSIFIGILAILSKLWEMSYRYVLNSIIGVALLLILIHVMDVPLKITLLTLIVTALLGVPGVVFVVVMHYMGIVI